MEVKKIMCENDIPEDIKYSPFGELIRYQNLGETFKTHNIAQMLVAMCMDNRKQLRIPENFAYIIRTGGANLRRNEFKVAYAIAVGGVKHVALIAHDNCGMVNLSNRRQQFVDGLETLASWSAQDAGQFFDSNVPFFEIGDEIEFAFTEAERLGKAFSGVKFLPLYYTLNDNMLHLIVR